MMSNIQQIAKEVWGAILEPLSELAIYLFIAFLIQKIFLVTYMQGISIVFVFFTLSLLRDTLATLVRSR